MLQIQNLSKSYGSQTLFDDITLQLAPGERLGLVGRNGHGKSTLFRIILQEEHQDDGQIITPRGYRIGHVAQHIHWEKPTILEEACLGLPEEESHASYKAEKILFGLGFSEADMNSPPDSFSGGFQVRLNLAKVLVSEPNLLLLDEPTNYLDIVSIRWITKFLRQWPYELMIISHDRQFMDSVTTHTAAIHRHDIRKVRGNTGKLYEQILQDEEVYERTRINESKQRKHLEDFVRRFGAKATKASAAQSRVKMLEKMPEREKLAAIEALDFSFRYEPFQAKSLMTAKNLSFGYEVNQPLIQKFSLEIKPTDRIGIIGKNGRGKSTLLNLLAGILTPQTGKITQHEKLKLGYFGQTHIERLHPEQSVEQEIGASNPDLGRTAVRSICGTMMFTGDLAEKKIKVLSGGEKSRVQLGKVIAHPSNLLLLDEPTNHLDLESVETLIDNLELFPGAVILVTHSEEMLQRVVTKLIVFQQGRVEIFNGSYDEFLRKVGWQEDDGVESAPSQSIVAEPIKNKKERRQQRSQIIAERTKVLGPLNKKIKQLENDICTLEAELEENNVELQTASEQKNIEQFIELSKTIKAQQKDIDKKFKLLEEATQSHGEAKKEFELRLTELDGG